MDSLCEGNPNLRLPHDTECQLYYDCSAEEPPFFSPAEKYLRECKYPMLFSTKSMKCEDFESVVCSSRKELKQMCKSIVLYFFCFEIQNAHNYIYLVIKEFHIAILYFTICLKLVEIQMYLNDLIRNLEENKDGKCCYYQLPEGDYLDDLKVWSGYMF